MPSFEDLPEYTAPAGENARTAAENAINMALLQGSVVLLHYRGGTTKVRPYISDTATIAWMAEVNAAEEQ